MPRYPSIRKTSVDNAVNSGLSTVRAYEVTPASGGHWRSLTPVKMTVELASAPTHAWQNQSSAASDGMYS